MATKRLYQSGAAKRKAKKQRIESEAKGKRTLEEFGWKAIVRPSGEQDDEMFVSLDTGSSLSVLPTAQPECDDEYEEDSISGTSGNDSVRESDGQDLDGDDLKTGKL